VIPPGFSRYAEHFLNLQDSQTRAAIIDMIVDDICHQPRLEPHEPDSRKRVYLVLPAIFTKHSDVRWWVIYHVVTYPQERRTIVEVANIGRADEPQSLIRPLD
jgi:hypothetical protein